MVNRFLAGAGCIGMAALYIAGMLANERVLSVVEEAGVLASAVAFFGLALLQFSGRTRTRLFTAFSVKP